MYTQLIDLVHDLMHAGPSLPSILKMLMLEQNQLDEKVSYPRINNIVGATLEGPVI